MILCNWTRLCDLWSSFCLRIQQGTKYNIRQTTFAQYVADLRAENKCANNSYLAVQNIKKALPQLQVGRSLGVHKVSFSPFAAVSLCGVAGLAGNFASFPVRVRLPFLPDIPGLQVPSDSVVPPQLRSSSRALHFHLHFHNCSDVFCFISSCTMPDPFQHSNSHDHRNRFHLCFLQRRLISPVFQQAYPHCPSHQSHLCCCHTLFIFN